MKIAIKDNRLYADKKKINLISGEVHYWRLDPELWPKVLRKVKGLGLKVVATYICWDFHEIKEGEFDFIGETNPRRNLHGFLSLLKEMGFWVIIRPGPYIYSEWRNLGVPDHAANYHRLHPDYLKKASVYIKEVSRIIKPFLATNNGNIILFQPDNEIDPFLYRFSDQLGLYKESGPFKDYIKKKYKNVSRLNNAWQTKYKSFKSAKAFLNYSQRTPGEIKRFLDLKGFLNDYVCRCAKWVLEEYRKNSIDVPSILNCYTGFKIQDPFTLSEIGDIVGYDIYPAAEFKEYNKEFREYLQWLRVSGSISPVSYIAEFESGIWYGRHFKASGLKANHYRLKDIAALAMGVKGFNWYMLVNRDNWQESPINEQADVRGGIYNAFKEVANIYNNIDIPALKPTANVALSLDSDSFHIKSKLTEEVLSAAYEADIDYKLFLFSDDLPPEKLLIYASEDWLSKDKQKKLYNYVKKGGNLVFFNNACLYDEALQLNNPFGFKEAEGSFGGEDMIYSINNFYLDLNHKKIPIKAPLLCYNKLKGRGIKVYSDELINSLNAPIGKKVKKDLFYDFYCGHEFKIQKGRVLCLYLRPTAELMRAVCDYFKIKLPSASLTKEVSTSVLKGSNNYYLFVLNNSGSFNEALIKLDKKIIKGINSAADLLNNENKVFIDRDNSCLSLKIKAKDATVIKL
jgi:beta-galactosidase GanA